MLDFEKEDVKDLWPDMEKGGVMVKLKNGRKVIIKIPIEDALMFHKKAEQVRDYFFPVKYKEYITLDDITENESGLKKKYLGEYQYYINSSERPYLIERLCELLNLDRRTMLKSFRVRGCYITKNGYMITRKPFDKYGMVISEKGSNERYTIRELAKKFGISKNNLLHYVTNGKTIKGGVFIIVSYFAENK